MKRGLCIQALVLLVCCVQLRLTAPADDTDEKPRPYQFGFNIGSQHREEKKDENGIVTGEYGFLTADGYYNIVMYATDVKGKFIITGRKRIRMEPPKPKPDEGEARKARAKEEAAARTTTTTTTTTERVKIYQFNYTAPQHGRQEMGFSDSSKMGDYYWDGPDGYRRIVTYNADDAGGYRPIVKQVKLPVP